MRTLPYILAAFLGLTFSADGKQRRVETGSATYNKKMRQAQKRKPTGYQKPSLKTKPKRARYPGRK